MEESIDILTETGERFCKLTYSASKGVLHMRGKSVRFDTLAAQVYAGNTAGLKKSRPRGSKKQVALATVSLV